MWKTVSIITFFLTVLEYPLFRTLENFKLTMDTGIPELGMPPLDPINIDIIEFKFFNLTISFNNVLMNGFKNFTVKKSVMDKKKRSCFTCSAKVDYI